MEVIDEDVDMDDGTNHRYMKRVNRERFNIREKEKTNRKLLVLKRKHPVPNKGQNSFFLKEIE
jgi:hypothetical protein